MNARLHEYQLYNAPTDSTGPKIKATNAELALDAFAESVGWPSFEEMKEAGLYTEVSAHLLQ